ncbi:hypothetical protein ACIQCJ_09125 [Streptomyces sp. NPDC093221]|uniref:hypothetical protein n=1 Tax=Streptomyces sp. NPDC093221 TaxID=3366032 RepID=UPI00380B203D
MIRHTVPAAGVAVAGALLLAACGGGSGGSRPSATGSGKATGSASAASPSASASASASASGGSGGANPVDGPTFCAFLAKEGPRIKDSGAPAGAKAFFAIDLANWIEQHPDQKPRTAADLDAAALGSCPKYRATVTSAMGAASFTEALG